MGTYRQEYWTVNRICMIAMNVVGVPSVIPAVHLPHNAKIVKSAQEAEINVQDVVDIKNKRFKFCRCQIK